jgi:ribose transport system substrate-binding protein
MTWRACLAVSALAALLAPAPGCQRERKTVIGVVPKSTSHLFWLSVQAGALAAAKDYEVEIEWNGPAIETDFSRQLQIVDSMITRRVDALALAAGDRTALIAPVDRAAAAGIPVAIFDSGLDSTNYATFIATDNYAAGAAGARKLAQLIGGRGDVAMVANAPGSTSTMDREQGFEETLKQEFPRVRIVGRQFGMADRAKARAAAENLLTANPGLDGIFASSEPSSVGVAMALRSRNLAGKVKFVSFDSSDSMVEDLRANVSQAMVVQDPFKMGYQTVESLVQKLRGETPPKRIDLEARVITRPDLEKPEVIALLQPDVQKHLGH